MRAARADEETGLVADQLTPLCTLHLSNSVTDEGGYVFLDQGLKSARPRGGDGRAVTAPVPLPKPMRWCCVGRSPIR